MHDWLESRRESSDDGGVLTLFDLSAVFLSAVSGGLAGKQKGMDWFGMYVLGVITGAGGGTLRSVLIGNLPIPIFREPWVLLICVPAVMVAWWGGPIWARMRRAVSVLDGLALGLFTAVGAGIALDLGHPWWVAVICGVITATFGGVLRDIARAEVPLIFRKEIYATASLLGAFLLVGLDRIGMGRTFAMLVITVFVTTIRLVAIRYSLNQSSE